MPPDGVPALPSAVCSVLQDVSDGPSLPPCTEAGHRRIPDDLVWLKRPDVPQPDMLRLGHLFRLGQTKAMVDRRKWLTYSGLRELKKIAATSRKPLKPPSEGEGRTFESCRVRQ